MTVVNEEFNKILTSVNSNFNDKSNSISDKEQNHCVFKFQDNQDNNNEISYDENIYRLDSNIENIKSLPISQK